ncbi:MAG: hypothetical protein FWF62_01895 [Candidatus Bathyarchaeota archaeon]|nr:hypothetical protein [Candidatus Termiticorpusculum sp.]
MEVNFMNFGLVIVKRRILRYYKKLLAPLNIVINYVNKNWTYTDNITAEKLVASKRGLHKKNEHKHLSLRMVFPVGATGDSFFKK